MTRGAALMVCAYLTVGSPAAAQTLAEVVRAVAEGSPVIAQAQAQADAAGAAVGVVRAAGRPQLSLNGNAIRGTEGANAQAGFDQTVDSDLSLLLPIYSGGRVEQGSRGARARVESSLRLLDQARADAIAAAAIAYLDVLRDRAALALVERNVGLLEQVLAATRRQYEEGDSTRTDIAQASSRLSLDRARLESAKAAVLASEARFGQLVGVAPGALSPPPALALPAIGSEAIAVLAIDRSGAVAAANASRRAARADVSVARAGGRPQLSATVSAQAHDYRASYAGYAAQSGAGGRATASLAVPVYVGGRVGADVRRASALVAEADGAAELARRETASDARRALIDYCAQLAAVALDEERVGQSTNALKGVQADQRAGNRSVLDVLDATSELLEAETGLLNSRHDSQSAAIAVFRLLNRVDCLASSADDACASVMYRD